MQMQLKNSILLGLMALGPLVSAHMEMSYPPPFRSKYNTLVDSGKVDYSMTSPLTASQYPCKGYQSDLGTADGASVVTWTPGSDYNFTVVGGATHGGGSCQAQLSYDKGATFKVIQDYVGGCPMTSGQSFPVTIPSDAPAGDALFAWTWYNQIGNREIYMNCASVTIAGASSKRASTAVSYSSAPGPFVANIDNGCVTVEGKDVVFPDPSANTIKNSTVADDTGSFTGTNCVAPGSAAVASGSSGSGSSVVASASPVASSASAAVSPVASTMSTVVVSSASNSAASATLSGGVFATTGSASSATSAVSPSPEVSSASASPAAASSTVAISSASSTSAAPAASGTGSSSTSSGALTGACTSEGMFNCVGGTAFQQCASGTWSVMMDVAAGTTCTPGQSMDMNVEFAQKSKRSVRRHMARLN